ncbi:helix-turn-helix domain-containing protein [Clostridium beijerinckii]|uniref:AraC-like DNA-binding protein n=1 Tax=Clostridium beijerinckii TaxID=1520 RepID=A0AAE5H0Y7_CLOBE|nr:AraC family transcriptional regulator [Clostridium beijerinckii]NSB12312.1 AraC-like DNA-binding protein [Clostridium beijerinckii]OOM30804.1 regulatory protein PchR [Clostridium beijerinckii]
MFNTIESDCAYEKGYGAIANEIYFNKEEKNKGEFFYPLPQYGQGFIYQINPYPGLFISVGDWIPYITIERHYEVDSMFMEIYLVESGDIVLIQNGKKTYHVSEGVNIYLNKTKKGRICYKENTPIKYVGILIFEDFIKHSIEKRFSKEDFDFDQVYKWNSLNYDTPEMNLLFLQIKQKLLTHEKSRLFFESKVGELLSIIMINFNNEKKLLENTSASISSNDLKRIQLVKSEIDNNISNPPDILHLCQLAAMGKTKLRESFKKAYNMPIGEYIRISKMKYALILINNNSLTVEDVAHRLGYSSSSKFSITFKKIYGHTPVSYRKNILMHS